MRLPSQNRGHKIFEFASVFFHLSASAPPVATIPPNLAGRPVSNGRYEFVKKYFFPNIIIWRITVTKVIAINYLPSGWSNQAPLIRWRRVVFLFPVSFCQPLSFSPHRQ